MRDDLSDEENDDISVKPPVKGDWSGASSDDTKNPDFHGLGDLNNPSNISSFAMAMKTFEFADNTTMHGLRYICMRNISQVRRIAWTVIVLSGMAYCTYLVYQTFSSYLEYPTMTKVSTQFEKKSEFPAITMCDYNALNKTKLTPKELAVVSHVYGNVPLPAGINISDFDDVDMKKFFYKNGYDYSYLWCRYNGLVCPSNLVKFYITDFGRCVTYDPSSSETFKFQTRGGKGAGVYLAGTFEPDEWTFGPNYYEESFRIKIHKPGTIVMEMSENAIPLLPGLTSEITISRREAKLLPPPYGDCGTKPLDFFDTYSKQNCMLECKTKHSLSVCGCQLMFMPGPGHVCSFREMKECDVHVIKNPDDAFDATQCECPPDCVITEYIPHVALAKPSQGFGEIVEKLLDLDLSNAAGAKIFYEDLQYIVEVEEPVYSVEKLLCDVGGASGLFLGCSFVTFVEFLDFMVEFVWFWSKKGAILKQQQSGKIDVTT